MKKNALLVVVLMAGSALTGATPCPAQQWYVSGRFEPYLGAGIGFALNHVDEMTCRFPENTGNHKLSGVSSGDRTDMAYMLTVGTGVGLSERMVLDIACRYQNLGKIGTDRGLMTMDILPQGIEIDETVAQLRTHGISAGLRYRF